MLFFIHSSGRLNSKRKGVWRLLLLLGIVVAALPVLRFETPLAADNRAEEQVAQGPERAVVAEAVLQQERANDRQPAGEADLRKRWKALSKKEAAEITRGHIHGLMRAAHQYHEVHGSIPPAVVANPKLPVEKRLSGLVLLLPHLDADSWIDADSKCFDEKTVERGKTLFKSIDLTKAWDDPANIKAARTIFPAFLAPQSGAFRDENGFAVSHFAFVQGVDGNQNGAFPGEDGMKFNDFTDGTSNTLGIGQIAEELGPWIAGGTATSRQLVHPWDGLTPTFGSQYENGCYFANCDSASYFLVLEETPEEILRKLVTRAGGDLILNNSDLVRSTLPPEAKEEYNKGD